MSRTTCINFQKNMLIFFFILKVKIKQQLMFKFRILFTILFLHLTKGTYLININQVSCNHTCKQRFTITTQRDKHTTFKLVTRCCKLHATIRRNYTKLSIDVCHGIVLVTVIISLV